MPTYCLTAFCCVCNTRGAQCTSLHKPAQACTSLQQGGRQKVCSSSKVSCVESGHSVTRFCTIRCLSATSDMSSLQGCMSRCRAQSYHSGRTAEQHAIAVLTAAASNAHLGVASMHWKQHFPEIRAAIALQREHTCMHSYRIGRVHTIRSDHLHGPLAWSSANRKAKHLYNSGCKRTVPA